MNQIKEIKKEYLEKFDGLIGDVQENKTDKFVIDLVWSFIETSLLAYKKEIDGLKRENSLLIGYKDLAEKLSKDTRKKKE